MANGAFQHRSGRVISLARLSLAAVFLIAIWFDPSQPSRYPFDAYAVLIGYIVIAAGYLAATWTNWWLENRLAIFAHAADIMLFGAMVYLTEGYTSPFFTFFVFIILSATIRWGWKETAATATVVILVFMVAGLGATKWHSPDLDVPRIIARSTYLIILSLLLIWFSLNQRSGLIQRLGGRDAGTAGPSAEPPIREGLEQAAARTGARRAALLWWDEDEPWLYLATLKDGRFDEQRCAPGAFGELVDARLARRTFLFDAAKGRALAARGGDSERMTGIGAPLDARLRAQIGCDEGLAIPVATETHGALFVLCEIPGLCADDLQVGKSLGEDFAGLLQQSSMLGMFEAAATNRTRLAISRDLHDTIVQLLAGTALRLQGIRQAIAAGRDAGEDLKTLQEALAVEQAGMRLLIGELRSGEGPDRPTLLCDGLIKAAEQSSRQWGVRAGLGACPTEARAGRRLHHEINQLVREAIANAAKHGGASEVTLTAAIADGALSLAVRDNGSGFGDSSAAPRSLTERIRELGGSVMVESTGSGATVTLRLPWEGQQ